MRNGRHAYGICQPLETMELRSGWSGITSKAWVRVYGGEAVTHAAGAPSPCG